MPPPDRLLNLPEASTDGLAGQSGHEVGVVAKGVADVLGEHGHHHVPVDGGPVDAAEGGLGVVFDEQLGLAGELFVGELGAQVQGHVDAGRDPGRAEELPSWTHRWGR